MYISKTMVYGGVEMNYCFLCNDFLVQYKNKRYYKIRLESSVKWTNL